MSNQELRICAACSKYVVLGQKTVGDQLVFHISEECPHEPASVEPWNNTAHIATPFAVKKDWQ